MSNLDNIVNDYINNQLLNLDNLNTKLESKMIDRLFAKKFRKYSIDPQVRIDVETKLNNIIENKLPLNFIRRLVDINIGGLRLIQLLTGQKYSI